MGACAPRDLRRPVARDARVHSGLLNHRMLPVRECASSAALEPAGSAELCPRHCRLTKPWVARLSGANPRMRRRSPP
jgi:hypothetical protein